MDERPGQKAAPGPRAAPASGGALAPGHRVRLPLLLVSILVLPKSHQQPAHGTGGAGDDLRAAAHRARGGVSARKVRTAWRRGERILALGLGASTGASTAA